MSVSGDSSLTARINIEVTKEGILLKLAKDVGVTNNEFKKLENELDNFVKKSNQAADSTSKLAFNHETAARKATEFSRISQTATASLQKLNQSMTSTGQSGNALTNTYNQLATSTQKVEAATSKFSAGLTSSITAYSTAAISIWGLYNAWDNLEKVQLQADKASLAAEKAQTRLLSLQNQYNEKLAKGTMTEADAIIMKEKLTNAEDQVMLAQERAKIAAEDYQELMIGFATQVLPFAMTAGVSFINMIETFRTSQIRAAIASVTLSGAVKGLGAAVKSFMASNPYLLAAMIAISFATLAFSQNMFGLRDAINAVGKAIGDFLPFLKPLLEGLSWFGKMISGVGEETKSTTDFMKANFSDMSEAGVTGFNNLSTGANEASIKIDKDIQNILSSLDVLYKKINIKTNEKTLFGDLANIVDLNENTKKLLKDRFDINVSIGAKLDASWTEVIPKIFETLGARGQNSTQDNELIIDLEKLGISIEDIKKAAEGLPEIWSDTAGKLYMTEATFNMLLSNLQKNIKDTEINANDLRNALSNKFEIKLNTEDLIIFDKLAINLSDNLIGSFDAELKKLKDKFQLNFDKALNIIPDNTPVTNWLNDILSQIEAENVTEAAKEKGREIAKGIAQGYVTSIKTSNDEFLNSINSVVSDSEKLMQVAGYYSSMTEIAGVSLDNLGRTEKNNINILDNWMKKTDDSGQKLNVWTGILTNNKDAFSGLDETAKKSAEQLTDFINTNKELIDSSPIVGFLIDLIAGKIGELGEKTKKTKDGIMSMAEVQKIFLANSAEVSKAVESVFSGASGQAIFSANKEEMDVIIATFDDMIAAAREEGNVVREAALMKIKEGLIPYRQVLDEVDQKIMESTNLVYQQSVELGVGKERLQELVKMKGEDAMMTNQQIIAAQNYNIQFALTNGLYETAEERQIRLNNAKYLGIGSAQDWIKSMEEEEVNMNAQIEVYEQYAHAAGVTIPKGLEKTVENMQLLNKAAKGNVAAIQELSKRMNEAAIATGGLSKKQAEASNNVMEMAKNAGVSADRLRYYNSLMRDSGYLTDQLQINLLREAIAANRASQSTSGLASQINKLKGVLSGQQQVDSFFDNLETQAWESTVRLQGLINKAKEVGATMSMIRKMSDIGDLETFITEAYFGGDPNDIMDEITGGSKKSGKKDKDKGEKQKIDKKAIREDAIQQAIEEAKAVDHLVDKLISETDAIRDLALETGIGTKQMEKYKKATNEFGIATEKARLELLKLTAEEARNIKFLTNSNEQLKDKYMALIEGAKAANDYTREARRAVIAEKEQHEQLLKITKALGISLPHSLDITVENLQNLISAAYGSEEAMEALRESALAVGEFYRNVLDDAKQAITDANFEEFVKKELLFEGVGDEFFRNITRELQSEMKLEKIADQMTKQLSLIQLNPDMFKSNVSSSELESGIRQTISTIEATIAGNPRLEESWRPILDSLNNVINSPDIHTAIQSFAQKFPNMVEPALTGVNIAMKGLDTQINETFNDTKNQAVNEYDKTIKNLKNTTSDIEKELIKEAKAAQKAAESEDDLSDSVDYGNRQFKRRLDFLEKNRQKLEELMAANIEYMKQEAINTEDPTSAVSQVYEALGVKVQDIGETIKNVNMSTLVDVTAKSQNIAHNIDENVNKKAGLSYKNMEASAKDSMSQQMLHGANSTKLIDSFYKDLSKGMDTGWKGTEKVAGLTNKNMTTDSQKAAGSINSTFGTNIDSVEGYFAKVAHSVRVEYMPSIYSSVKAMANSLPNAMTQGIAAIHGMFDELVKKAGTTVTNINSKFAGMQKEYTITIKVEYDEEKKPSSIPKAAGFSGVVNKETHFTVGEAGRPELISIIPLSYDHKKATGRLVGGEFGVKVSTPNINGGAFVRINEEKGFEAGYSSGGKAPIYINVVTPVSISGNEIKRYITSQTFDQYDNQYSNG